MTADDFRHLALAFDGAVEKAHMGHPDFRAGGRIFASLHAGGLSGALKLTPSEQRELVRTHPEAFSPASGAWGRQGWTTVLLEEADEASVRGALVLAWEGIVSKRPRSGRVRSKRTTAGRTPRRPRR